jgi:glycosyltransferase involved in cell wall biosynthesis
MNPRASLIVAVYKRPDFLEKIFASVRGQTRGDFEVLIADDGSGQDVAGAVRRFAKEFSRPMRHIWHRDAGFRKTIIVNEAVAKAGTDYLVFIDGDCVLHHRFMERHLVNRRKGVVLAGRRVMLDEAITARLSIADIQSKRIERPSFWWNNCGADQRKHGLYVPGSFTLENAFGKRYWIVGSNFSVHASDFQAVNGYDESITGRGLEDINLTERFRLKGVRIKTITREALQYHLFHTSDPVPHDAETYRNLCFPKQYWAQNGLDHHREIGRETGVAPEDSAHGG